MMLIGIVDDKRILRQSLAEQLKGRGLSVILMAGNGKDFLEKIKELSPNNRPNAVLMDIEMPELNGIDTVNTAKELYPEINFIMLTVFDEDDKIFEAIRAGASGYLLKDEKVEKIIEALSSVGEGGAPMSPKIARKTLELLKFSSFESKVKSESDDYSLTEREMGILKLTVEGKNYNQVADQLFISPQTVKKHIKNIYKKLHVNSKLSAAKVAMKKGWFN
jgi:DNA-binding NarL/FixJ family response regulator